jgi:hypothetical protein
MNRFWIVLVFVFTGMFARAEEIDLPLLGRENLNIFSAMTFHENEGSVFTGGISETRNKLVRIDLDRGGVTEYFEIHRFLGRVDGRILVSTVDRDHILKLLYVDVSTLEKTKGPDWTIPLDWALLPGRDGSMYSARLDSRGVYTPFRFDPNKQIQTWLEIEGVPTSLTPDTLHLLIQNPDTGAVYIWNTEDRSIRGRLRSNDPAGQVRFLTNSVLLVPPQYSGQDRWRVYDLEGDQVGEVRFRISAGDPLFFWFTADLKRAVVCVRGRLNPETAVVNTEALRLWLQREGHLFTPTRGVLNDSRVRVRAYPTLEAQIVGHLDRGDRVEVLERSGQRVSIGSMNDFWYLVQREDGLSGWSYGYFIDLP